MKAPIRGTSIWFDIDGASLVVDGSRMRERPTAFLVHGGPGVDHSGYKVRYAALARKMQVVYFDHRGHGRSASGDPQKYTLDENVEDMEALRRYLGLGPIVSLGGSYGGMVAMAHAARYPQSVSHLILACTASHAGFIARGRQMVAEHGTVEQLASYDDLLAGRIDSADKQRRYYEVMGPLFSRRFTLQSGTGLGGTIYSPEAFNRAWGPGGFLRSFDLRPQLKAITAPTLILAGRHDWICPPEFSEEIHRLVPGSDLRIFEESSHTFGTDEPEYFLDAVAGFIVYQSRMARRDP